MAKVKEGSQEGSASSESALRVINIGDEITVKPVEERTVINANTGEKIVKETKLIADVRLLRLIEDGDLTIK